MPTSTEPIPTVIEVLIVEDDPRYSQRIVKILDSITGYTFRSIIIIGAESISDDGCMSLQSENSKPVEILFERFQLAILDNSLYGSKRGKDFIEPLQKAKVLIVSTTDEEVVMRFMLRLGVQGACSKVAYRDDPDALKLVIRKVLEI